MKTNLRLVFSISLLFLSFSFFGQESSGLWRREFGAVPVVSPSGESLRPGGSNLFSLDEGGLRKVLEPLSANLASSVIARFPDADGVFRKFEIREQSVFSPKLQARYPGIRSYSAVSLDADAIRIRFSLSHKSLQATLFSPKDHKTSFIEKVKGSGKRYILFSGNDKVSGHSGWICKTEPKAAKANQEITPVGMIEDGLLRRFRLAVAASGEYTQYHGGTVADALAAINATVTRINEVFERELAISLELIANTDLVIYTDPLTDPFSGDLNNQVQNTLTTEIGADLYDIGHLFHSDGENGNAGFIGAVCINDKKGSAFASTPIPEGDRFDLDFVAHEMGHQFGANHTWSFESEGTGVQVEPGSGTTIMGYAGIVDGDNVAPTGDDYFHYFSIAQIWNYVSGLSCGTEVPLNNIAPVIIPTSDYLIPEGTAFVLTGEATDANPSDILTYNWEQIDDGVVNAQTFGPENPSGANFRSRKPNTSPSRYFPRIAEIVAGNLTQTNPTQNSAWETVSNIGRDFNFGLTVRDNATGGGQVVSDEVLVRVIPGTGPFSVTSQSIPQSYLGGSVQEVTWDVAGTASGKIQCQRVDILMDLNGQYGFPLILAADVPNSGSALVQIPGEATTQGRIMVKASENVFLAVNSAPVAIVEQPFILEVSELSSSVCWPNPASIPLRYRSFGGFNELVNLTVSGLPEGLQFSFNQPSVQTNETEVLLNLTPIGIVSSGTYTIELHGTSSSANFMIPIELIIADGSFSEANLLFPQDGSFDVSLNPELQWQELPTATGYEIQLASDVNFTQIVNQQEVYGTSFRPDFLSSESDFYWRVRPLNNCGTGTYSAPFQFRTISTSCRNLISNGLPASISSIGTSTITSSVTLTQDLPIADLKVNLDLKHTYLADLVITLTSPSGTRVTLLSNSCGQNNDMDVQFSDDAPPFECANNPAISGTVRPLGVLRSFIGESAKGTWILTISDTATGDGGQLNAFDLELCVAGVLRPDDDNDGVFDDGDDLCLGTTPGLEVDATGCPIYRFEADNFQLTLDGETCRDAADGRIQLSAIRNMNYTLSLTGLGINQQIQFNNSANIDNLAAGVYQLCLDGVEGENIYRQQCFEVVIGSPPALEVLATQSLDGSEVTLNLSGAEAGVLKLNDQTSIISSSATSIQLKPGANVIEITAIPECLGSYRAVFFYAENPMLSPNPFEYQLDLVLPEFGLPTEVKLFNASGVLIYTRKWVPEIREETLYLPAMPTGLYLLRISQPGRELLYKIFRK